jgi:hypothetical protein
MRMYCSSSRFQQGEGPGDPSDRARQVPEKDPVEGSQRQVDLAIVAPQARNAVGHVVPPDVLPKEFECGRIFFHGPHSARPTGHCCGEREVSDAGEEVRYYLAGLRLGPRPMSLSSVTPSEENVLRIQSVPNPELDDLRTRIGAGNKFEVRKPKLPCGFARPTQNGADTQFRTPRGSNLGEMPAQRFGKSEYQNSAQPLIPVGEQFGYGGTEGRGNSPSNPLRGRNLGTAHRAPRRAPTGAAQGPGRE